MVHDSLICLPVWPCRRYAVRGARAGFRVPDLALRLQTVERIFAGKLQLLFRDDIEDSGDAREGPFGVGVCGAAPVSHAPADENTCPTLFW